MMRQRSQEADLTKSEWKSLGVKAIGKRLWRTWPYLKPNIHHLIIWICLGILLEGIFVLTMLVAFDLFNNKILVGEKLKPVQAALLYLDDSYANGTNSGNQDSHGSKNAIEYRDTEPERVDELSNSEPPPPKPMLTQQQRRVVRNRMMVLFAVLGIFLMGVIPVQNYYRTWILQRINQYLRVTMIERAENLSLRYHSHARTGDAIYRVYQDSATITNVVERALMEPIVAFGQILFSLAVIWIFSPYLGVLFLAGMLPILWLVAWYTPRIQFRAERARRTNSNLTSRIQEAFAAIRIVKSNLAERIMGKRFDRDSHAALDAAFYLRVETILMRTLVMMLAGMMVIIAQCLMAEWSIAGDETFLAGAIALVGFAAWNLGAFQSAQTRITEFVANTGHTIGLWGVVQDITIGLDRAFYLLDLKPEIVDAIDAVDMPAPIRRVTYRDVSFCYDEERPVLTGVNLTAEAGMLTAIVGGTGTGKSTLMSLLLRLYDPDEGSISINDTDIRKIQVEGLRSNIAIALQQNVLFAATVADNIAYASPNAARKAVEAAAKVACADRFIRQMTNGYDTELGERGGKLSSGQRQRLSIARAIIRNTPILILDEPTASLDAETEHSVLSNLAEWGRDRIVFLITHRLSTIRSADQIAFLEDGLISETGDHETLIERPDGRYRRFVQAESLNAKSVTDREEEE